MKEKGVRNKRGYLRDVGSFFVYYLFHEADGAEMTHSVDRRGYWLDNQGIVVRFSEPALDTTKSHNYWYRVCFSSGRRQGREADLSLPYRLGVVELYPHSPSHIHDVVLN